MYGRRNRKLTADVGCSIELSLCDKGRGGRSGDVVVTKIQRQWSIRKEKPRKNLRRKSRVCGRFSMVLDVLHRCRDFKGVASRDLELCRN